MPELQWQVINDFRPGIQQLISPNHPPGTAQADGTYRCYALSSGALAPLPKRTNTIRYTPPISQSSNLAEQFRIIGLHVNDPVYWPGETTPGIDQNNSELFMGIEWWDNDTGGNRLNLRLAKYLRHYQQNPTWRNPWSVYENTVYADEIRPRHMDLVTQRSNNTTPTEGGPAVVAWVVNGHAHYTPKDSGSDVYSDTIGDLPGDKVVTPGTIISPDGMIGHQGRIVIFPLLTTGAGHQTLFVSNEALYWTEINDIRTLDDALSGSYFKQFGNYENPKGYGVIASLSSNELFLIKQRGGALVVRGNLPAATVEQRPYVRGTGLSLNYGTRSPIGYMYPVDSGGIWLWKGGDVSQHITPNMDPDFWRPSTNIPANSTDTEAAAYGHAWTSCSDWNEWVLFPNNWILDTDISQDYAPFGAWWRIDDTSNFVAHRWAVDFRGRKAYCTPSGFRSLADPAIIEFSMADKANDYRWHGQPMSFSLTRQVQIREVVIIGTGQGQVTLRIKTDRDQAGRPITVPINHTSRPHVHKVNVDAQGSHIEVLIDSESGNSNIAAPTIHEVRLGYYETTQLPN